LLPLFDSLIGDHRRFLTVNGLLLQEEMKNTQEQMTRDWETEKAKL